MTYHVHNNQLDKYTNIVCRCGKIFVRLTGKTLDDIYRTDEYRDI